MEFIRKDNGQRIRVASQPDVGSGGEAGIHSVLGSSDLVAKLYKQPRQLTFDKIRAMLSKPPAGHPDHITTAWPLAIIIQADGHQGEVGYLMPRITNVYKVFELFNPSRRREVAPTFNFRSLTRLARNVAVAFADVHAAGHVVGDVNESNVLATKTAMATLVDTDSFQIRGSKSTFRCQVGRPEYSPPELQGIRFDEVERTIHSDAFGLAVLIFQILMEGVHPFDGVRVLGDEPESREKRISRGAWPYLDGSGYKPAMTAPPLSMIDEPLRLLFWHAFVNGHKTSSLRPTAQEWAHAIDHSQTRLVSCNQTSNHFYWPHLDSCPWCDRYRYIGQDSFATPTTRNQLALFKNSPVLNNGSALSMSSAKSLRVSENYEEADLVLRILLSTGVEEGQCYFELGMVNLGRRKIPQALAHLIRARHCGFQDSVAWQEAATFAATFDKRLASQILELSSS